MPRFSGFFALVLVLVLTPNAVRMVAAESPEEPILVRFSKGNDVFSPQEVVALEILPGSPEIFSEKLKFLTVTLHRTSESVGIVRPHVKKFPDDSTRLASVELEVSLPNDPQAAQWIPVPLVMPTTEGVYDIGLSFHRTLETEANPGFNRLIHPGQRQPPKTAVQSVVSCVVVNPAPVRRPVGELQLAAGTEQPETVDTANPAWWRRFPKVPALPKVTSLPRIPGLRPPTPTMKGVDPEWTSNRFRSGPLNELLEPRIIFGENSFGNGHFKEQTTIPTIATPLSALSAPESSDTLPWQVIPLSIKEPGKPHLLEIEYPSGVPQTLGITVVELIPPENKPVPTISAESGIHVAEEIVSDPQTNRLLTHRIVFWPKTKSPMLLLTNRQANRDAVFGKVNTFQLADDPTQPFDGEMQRLLAGYVLRPEILESLASSVGSADWETFYEGATRFVDRLKHGGYDGIMLVVAANGKTIYPAARYGYGPFTGPLIGHDGRPVTKDVLELLARLFDREGLAFIPTIDFNSPLPALEYAIQQNPNLAVEFAWIGPNGPVFLPSDRSGTVSGPFYNLLHPSVQEAMIDAVRELARRCARHPSFGGVSVVLSPEGFAQIPDPFWGIDDTTITRFQRETNLELPDGMGASTAPNRLTARVEFFQKNAAAWETWIRWRTLKVNEFYRRVAQALTEIRPDATLYLAGGAMLDAPSMQQYCMPSLLYQTTLTRALRLTGFDRALFAETPSVVFLHPSRQGAEMGNENAAIHRELETAEWGTITTQNSSAAGTLFFHGSPASEDAVTVPSGAYNRRRFVQRMAQEDVLTFFDGGNALPLGEEESLYPFTAAFRKLPRMPFRTFSVEDLSKADGNAEKSLQPITVRYLETASGLFVYLLNDAPFGVDGRLTFSVSKNVVPEDLGGRRPITPESLMQKEGRLVWRVSLQPYDFIAVHLADPAAALRDVDVYRLAEICGPDGILKRKIEELGERFKTAQSGVLWNKLENPGCEMQADSKAELVGWTCYGDESLVAAHDPVTKYSGNAALKLELKTPAPAFCAVFSSAFPAPETGRLFVTAFLGVSEHSNPPPINVVLSATHRGTPLFRSFRVKPEAAAPGGVRWRKIVASFDRLPKENLEDFRIGFQLAGPGIVWVDDVMLYRVAFTTQEQAELQRAIVVADSRRSAERISDSLVLLESYWPKFLLYNVPAGPPSPVVAETRPPYSENKGPPQKPEPKPETPKPTPPGTFDRFKNWFSR